MATNYPYKLFRVLKDGKASTVSMDPLLANIVLQSMSPRTLKQTVQQLVDEWSSSPRRQPCSAYVTSTIRRQLYAQNPPSDLPYAA